MTARSPQARVNTYRYERARDWKRHGIQLTWAEFDVMMREQQGRCAACATPDAPTKSLHVDHDHITGLVRGLLCNGCNRVLGKVNDNVATLEALAGYLRRWT